MSTLDKEIRVAGIVPESVVDGKGIRLSVFVQGCPHRCEGCHNPHTHEFNAGEVVKLSDIAELIKANPLLDGITLSGGEPFVFAAELASLSKFVRAQGLNVWCYTGYTLEQLQAMAEKNPDVNALLSEIDILVDGRFEQEKRSLLLKFRGSSNQRLIDMNASKKQGKIVLLD